ncbi:MAG: hypothetical protein VXZ38_12880 [Planctomycetota bacterium]|nr:hypothetical protein [Planctomycetota bacterium]
MQGRKYAVKTALITVAITVLMIQAAAAIEVGNGQLRADFTTPGKASTTVASESSATGSNLPEYILAVPSFSIPFSVDRQDTDSTEVRLYVSPPNFDGWSLYGSKPLESENRKFTYDAGADGVYLFATRTVNQVGKEYPSTPLSTQIRVRVDTQLPRLTLEIHPHVDGKISLDFAAQDASEIHQASFRYATDSNPEWVEIASSFESKTGTLAFKPDQKSFWKYLLVEFSATDAAGNTARVIRQIKRPRLASEQHTQIASAKKSERVSRPVEGVLAGFREGNSREESNSSLRESNQESSGSAAPVQASGMISLPTERSELYRSDTSHQADLVRIAQLGGTPQRRISLFEKLFGMSPPLSPNGPPRAQYYPETFSQGMSSTLAAVPSRLVGNPQELLPPPASPAQIGEGFGMNNAVQPLRQSQSAAVQSEGNGTETSQTDSLPETLSSPLNLKDSEKTANASMVNRNAQTPAQAMRPIEETSQVVPLLKEKESKSDKTDEVETEKPPRYQSNRNELSDSLALDPESAVILERVPLRFSKGKRFSLDYELEAVGLQGAESIELYGTTDNGKTWQLWGSDPDQQSPFDIETQDVGVFGFRICVVGRNGLASPRPLTGEAPDIFVVVDVDDPQVRITGAKYGEGSRVGSLVISYECVDRNLPLRPITLAFSDSLEGPWTTIVAGLRNEGQYIWAADPSLPRQLYLRIDAVDEAGNRGVYLLDQPIDTQGLAPRAKIRGFQPLSQGPIQAGKTEATAKKNKSQY